MLVCDSDPAPDRSAFGVSYSQVAIWILGGLLVTSLAFTFVVCTSQSSDYIVIEHANPFRSETQMEALRQYLDDMVLADGTADMPVTQIMAPERPTIIFIFDPIDCSVCLNYMTQMRAVLDSGVLHTDQTFVTVAFHTDQIGVSSLAYNFRNPDTIYRVVKPSPPAWSTPIVVIVDRSGRIRFANAIIISQDRQEVLIAETALVIKDLSSTPP